MPALLWSTSFLSAALLFCLEPMVGKMVLPLLGGTPAVWNTCLVFFQMALLGGYAYAHGTLSWLGVRRQARLHAALIVPAFFTLPVLVTSLDVVRWPADASLGPRLFLLLVVRVGMPFVLVAASAPLLQRWLSLTSGRQARDPYFLYAASNAGSLLALLAYPLVIEPWMGGDAQRRAWRWGYALFAAMIIGVALRAVRIQIAPGPASPATVVATPLSGRHLRRWITLAAAPSALLIGVTTYLGTEVASFPLLWVAPLAVYLATFMLAFAGRRRLSTDLAARLLPLPLTCAFIVAASEATVPIWLALVLNLVTLFVAGMVCHGSLADERPDPAQLTGFYLAVAAGGALGGALATFVPPMAFTGVLEYPLELLFVALLRPAPATHPEGGRLQRGDLRWALFIGALSLLMALVLRALAVPPGPITMGLQMGVPIVVHYRFLHRPVRFALGLALLLVVARISPLSSFPRTVHGERTFFGLLRVIDTPDGRYRRLMHGTTVHGGQATAAPERYQPSTYYARSGPLGQIFERVTDGAGAPPRSVAVVGLGAGEVATYAKPGQAWTFYEIDPAVVRIARDPRYFTYLADAFPDGRGLQVELGDARLRLQDARDGGFDLLILDAFSSDAIPTHLLVREAVALYLRKLAPDGVLAVHISNRYLRLEPVIASLARDAGLVTACQFDTKNETLGDRPSKSASHWCALSRDPGRLAPLLSTSAWHPAAPSARAPPTDDRSSIFQMF